MIWFWKPLPPEKHANVLKVVTEHIAEPYAHDDQTFLFNVPLPSKHQKDSEGNHIWLQIFRSAGYVEGDRGAYFCKVSRSLNPEGRTVQLKDGSVHNHSAGKWHV